MSAIKQLNKALPNLEEVTVGFIGRESDDECLRRVRGDRGLRGTEAEWIIILLPCFVAHYFPKHPTHFHIKWEFIVDSQLLRFAESAALSEGEVQEVFPQLQVSQLGEYLLEHLFVQHHLVRIVDWYRRNLVV